MFEYPVTAAILYKGKIYKGVSHLGALNKAIHVFFLKSYNTLEYRLNSAKEEEIKTRIRAEINRNRFVQGYVTNKGNFLSVSETLLLLRQPELRNISIDLRLKKLLPRDIKMFSSDDWKEIYKTINPDSYLWGECLQTLYTSVQHSTLF